MIGYVTIGTNNMARAGKFYDELLGSIGAGRMFDTDTFVAWAKGPKSAALAIALPFNSAAATVGNGVMVAMQMDSTDKVDAFYAKAIELGAGDEGAPGFRLDNFYAGYFRDLDGNKLNAFCFTSKPT